MSDVVVGVLAVVTGLLLCFRGSGAMRFLLALWGAFVGFGLGAVLVAELSGQGYLATALGWVAAIVLGLVFAGLAYMFFAVAIVLAFGSMGIVLGQTLASALGASAPWLITTVGVVVGIILGLLAVATNMPEVVLVIISAFAGAAVAVGGLMLILEVLNLADLAEPRFSIGDQPLWYVAQLVLAIVGVVVQLRFARRQMGTVRESWSESGR